MPLWLFVTRDPQGREVGLSGATFSAHIEGRHPGVTPEMIRATIESPDRILENAEHNSVNYVAHVPLEQRRLYRLVGAKRFRGMGGPAWSVATAFPKALPPVGRTIWMRPSTP